MKNLILRYFSFHLKNVLENAQAFALKRKKGARKIEILDILKAIAHEKGSVGFNLLKGLKIFKILKGDAKVSLEKIDKNKLKTPISFSFESHNLIIGAIRAAQEFQFPYVGTEHLLFAILECNDQQVLTLIGHDRAELKKLIEQMKKVMSKTIDPQEGATIIVTPSEKTGSETAKQDFFKGIMGEMSELLNSLLEKRKKEGGEFPQNNFFRKGIQ